MSAGSEGNRWLGHALISVGMCALVVSIYISAKVGWSLADDLADRAATAITLGIADFSAAMLLLAASILWVRGTRWRSASALAFAGLFLAVGYTSAYGFFANRIAVHASHKAATKIDEDYLAWAKGQTVNRELPRSERLSMRAEVKAANQELKATASLISDRYAVPIASSLGWSLETTQARITGAIAAIVYAVKFAGLWFGPMFWPRRRKGDASIAASPKGSTGGDGGSEKSSDASRDKQPGSETANIVPFRAEAQFQATSKVSSEPPRVPELAPSSSLKSESETVAEFLAREGGASSQKAIAKRLGVSEAKVSRDVKKLKGQGKVKLERKWRSNAITHAWRNGGLHAVV